MRVAPIAVLVGLLGLLALAGCAADDEAREAGATDAADGEQVVMLRTETCDCCTAHAAHLEEEGFAVDHEIVDDPNATAGVPDGLGSCHVTVVDDYAVVGHVPADVIDELRSAAPDVDGVSLPGMPSGSPGMPGEQTEPWEFIAFSDGQPASVFTTR